MKDSGLWSEDLLYGAKELEGWRDLLEKGKKEKKEKLLSSSDLKEGRPLNKISLL